MNYSISKPSLRYAIGALLLMVGCGTQKLSATGTPSYSARGPAGAGSSHAGENKAPSSGAGGVTDGQANSEIGKAGSLARFAVANETLYALNSGRIVAFDISVPEEFKKAGSVRVASDIETLYSDGESLFIGAETALHIYSLETPHSPKALGVHPHVRACDPVVTSGEYAFVTLKSGGGACRGTTNVLKVVDFSNVTYPREVKRIGMNSPTGLGVAGDRLFVCDGTEGLVEFDIAQPERPYELSRARDEVCNDVIPVNDLLITTGPNGISQYDLSNDGFFQLSKIDLAKEE